MKKFIIPIAIIIEAALLTYVLIEYRPGVRPIYNQSYPQVTVNSQVPIIGSRTVTGAYDYLTVGELELTPIYPPQYAINEGKLWFDAYHDELRFQGGDYEGGQTIPRGKFMVDTLTFVASENDDTLEFPELVNIGFDVEYGLVSDTLNSAAVTFTLQDMSRADTGYVSMSSSVFPYTLLQKDEDKTFVCEAVAHKNRGIVDFDTTSNTGAKVKVWRKIHINGDR